jgi:hypothetical protein
MVVNRQASGRYAAGDDYNRSFGIDSAWQATPNGKLFTFLARTDSPASKGGADYAGRAFYSYANALVSASGGTRRWAIGSIRKSALSRARVPGHYEPRDGDVRSEVL